MMVLGFPLVPMIKETKVMHKYHIIINNIVLYCIIYNLLFLSANYCIYSFFIDFIVSLFKKKKKKIIVN